MQIISRFDLIREVLLKIQVLWKGLPCRLVNTYWRFEKSRYFNIFVLNPEIKEIRSFEKMVRAHRHKISLKIKKVFGYLIFNS